MSEVLSGCAVRAIGQLLDAGANSAVISDDEMYRYRLDRLVALEGIVFAFFGVNGSTATGEEEDQTTRKWFGFSKRNGARRYIVGNPFAFRATDVRALARASDPVGPENARYLSEIIAEADVLVPCWGNRNKVPKHLRHHIDALRDQIFASRKPVKVFGFTKGGDPLHPLMLGYDTPLTEWSRRCAHL